MTTQASLKPLRKTIGSTFILATFTAWSSLAGSTGVLADVPESLIAAAKKEGKVVVDGPPINTVRAMMTKGFEAKYGVKVSYISSGTSKSGSRVRAERAGGKFLLDVFVSGADTPLLTFKKGGWLDRIEPALVDPDVTNGKNWSGGHLWYMDPDKTVLRMLRYVTPQLVVNTNFVKADEIKSWTDLLKPQYKGKITAKDPTISGSGASLTAYFYFNYGPDFVRKLYKGQDPALTRSGRQIVQWVAQGKYPIAVGPSVSEFRKFQKRGFPVVVVAPSDGPAMVSGGWGTLSLMNKAPNPNAAKLFVNWLASREAQDAYARAVTSLSLRTDVPSDWAPDYIVPKKGAKYMDTYAYSFITKERAEGFERARKLLGQ